MLKFAGLFLGMILAVGAGCHNMHGSDAMGDMGGEKGVAAVMNQGSVVYLAGHGSEVKTLAASGATTCEQCKMDAANYFKTGMLTEKCSVCGANRYALMRGK